MVNGKDKFHDDNLITRWWDSEKKRVLSQRKRLPESASKVVLDIQSCYLTSSKDAVKFIMDHFAISFKEAVNVFRYLVGRRGGIVREEIRKDLGI